MVVLHLHVYLTHVVGAFADGLNGEFLECHLAVDDLLERFDGRVDRSVSACALLEVLTCDVESEACDRLDAHPAGHLEVLHLDTVVLRSVGPSQHEDVVVVDVFFLVSQLEEILVHLVEFLLREFHSQHMQTVLECGPSASGCEHDCVVVDADIVRVDDLVGLHVLQHTVLMDAA